MELFSAYEVELGFFYLIDEGLVYESVPATNAIPGGAESSLLTLIPVDELYPAPAPTSSFISITEDLQGGWTTTRMRRASTEVL